MSRSVFVVSVVSKAAWIASLAVDQVDSALVGGGVVLGILGVVPAIYHVADKLLERMMRLPEVFEPEPVRLRIQD
jgi:hypothetical protein